MVINVSETLKSFNGQTMKDIVEETNEKGEIVKVVVDATLRMALVNALLTPVQNETGIEKVKKYELARKIYKAENEVELAAEEIALCKKRVGEVFPNPIVVGQVLEMLEGK